MAAAAAVAISVKSSRRTPSLLLVVAAHAEGCARHRRSTAVPANRSAETRKMPKTSIFLHYLRSLPRLVRRPLNYSQRDLFATRMGVLVEAWQKEAHHHEHRCANSAHHANIRLVQLAVLEWREMEVLRLHRREENPQCLAS